MQTPPHYRSRRACHLRSDQHALEIDQHLPGRSDVLDLASNAHAPWANQQRYNLDTGVHESTHDVLVMQDDWSLILCRSRTPRVPASQRQRRRDVRPSTVWRPQRPKRRQPERKMGEVVRRVNYVDRKGRVETGSRLGRR